MDLLVIGGSGFLGRAVTRQALLAGHRVVATCHRSVPPAGGVDWRAVDIRRRDDVTALAAGVRPEVIVNAAYVQSDWETTADGGTNVALAAAAAGARLVHVSSDAVFSGAAPSYDETCRPDPTTPYGAAKAAAETAVKGIAPDAVIARTSLIIGDGDSKHERLVHALAAGAAGVLYTDEVRCPVHVTDLARALLELAAEPRSGVRHVAGADAVSRYELGVLVAARDGLDRAALPAGPRAAGPSDVRLDCARTQAGLVTRLRGARDFLAPAVLYRPPSLPRWCCPHRYPAGPHTGAPIGAYGTTWNVGADEGIGVFLADDNLIVREGVRALIERNADLRVVGVAADYDGVVAGCAAAEPQVLVTDVRMPPSFRREGIDAAREVRSRFPGTGVVVLSQYDDPEYAVSLLSSGSAGYGYLLKDRVAEGTQLADAIRAVATGGTALDPAIVEALVRPVVSPGGLSAAEEGLLGLIAEGRTVKAIAAARGVPPAAIDTEVEAVFVKLATGVSAGDQAALSRLRQLHQAIVDGKEQGETLSRLLPSGLADKLRGADLRIGETERVTVTVLMSDIRSYSTIAEKADPSALARQLNRHRAAMNKAILGQDGTVMQFVGDAVMAVFGAPFPQPDHADRAVAAAAGMHGLQAEINAEWRAAGLPEFGLGIGVSTGPAAAALLGSAERLEYTLVGDTVNLAQRLQGFAAAGETVISSATRDVLSAPVPLVALPASLVKGRETPVIPFKVGPPGIPAAQDLPAQERITAEPTAGEPVTSGSSPVILHDNNAAPVNQTQGTRTWKLWKALRQNGMR